MHPVAPACTKMHPDRDCIKVTVQSHPFRRDSNPIWVACQSTKQSLDAKTTEKTFGTPNGPKPKMWFIPRPVIRIEWDSGWFCIWQSKDPVKCEPERETDCRYLSGNIGEMPTKADREGHNSIFRDQKVAGSNPVTSTNKTPWNARFHGVFRCSVALLRIVSNTILNLKSNIQSNVYR